MSAEPVSSGGFMRVRELLDLDDRNGAPCRGAFDRVAEARKRYCGLQEVPLAQARPCGGCGGSAVTLVGGVFLHLTCPDPPPGWVPEPVPVPPWLAAAARGGDPGVTPGAGAAPGPQETEPGAFDELPSAVGLQDDDAVGEAADTGEHLAAVLAADGLWLPGADAPAAVTWPRNAGEAWELADRFRVRQLWIHPGAHEALGLPADHGDNPEAPDDHPWARAAGYACDPPGLAAWVHVSPDGGRRRAVVLPRYETRTDWADAPSGQVLLGAVTAFADALPPGCNYYYSLNSTAAAVIAHHARGGLPAVVTPPPGADRVVTHVASWSRPLMDDEAECRWLHRYDTRGAQLATWNVKLGVGVPVHHVNPRWIPGIPSSPASSKYTAGYWLVSLADGWRPDMRLPDLLKPWQRARASQIWVPTPFLELLADTLAAPVTIAEAWLWPQSSARLEAAGHSFRDARAALYDRADGCGTCPWCIALQVLKDCYSSAIGNFATRRVEIITPEEDARRRAEAPGRRTRAAVRAEDGTVAGPPGWDPYANDAIISKALANDYRRYKRTGEKTDRWPVAIFNDAGYYASDVPDGRQDVPPTMTLGGGLGQYSFEATAVLAAVSGELGGERLHRAVERHLRGNR